MEAVGSVRSLCKWSPHGIRKKGCQVIHRWPALDFQLGKIITMRLCDDHAEVMRFALRQWLWQRPEVGLPGLILLGQSLQLAFDEEGRTLAEFQAFRWHLNPPQKASGRRSG
jgi:hypothetical protein